MDWTKRLAVWNVVIGTIVLGLKYFAYHLTGSIALYSDALESIVNVATAVAALFAVHVSAKPADASHPFGHSKVEYLSAVIEGVLIVVAALSILRQAYLGFLNPTPLDALLLGMAVNGVAGVLNAVVAKRRPAAHPHSFFAGGRELVPYAFARHLALELRK